MGACKSLGEQLLRSLHKTKLKELAKNYFEGEHDDSDLLKKYEILIHG